MDYTDINFEKYQDYTFYVYVIKAYLRSNTEDEISAIRNTYSYYIRPSNNYIYYIGNTNRLKIRLSDHFCTETNKPNIFRIYKPTKIMEIIFGDRTIEDQTTLVYMNMYGLNNVRGGEWSSPYVDYTDELKNKLHQPKYKDTYPTNITNDTQPRRKLRIQIKKT